MLNGIYRGVLAEDYDGRSQKVLVSTSQGSSSAAYANILFQKTSLMEAGTPVLLKVINGQIYVVSGGGRLGRLCEDFDRDTEGTTAIVNSTVDEDGTDVWGDSQHEAEWSWQAMTATDPAPGDDIAAIDGSGAYVISGGANRDIYIETPENAIVIDYTFDLYVRFKAKSLGNERFFVKFDSSEDDEAAYVKVSFHINSTGGYQIITKATDSTLLPFVYKVNTWYWARINYSPGDACGVAIWEDTGDEADEPEDSLYELAEEDGAYIPLEINKFQLGFLNIDTTDRITVSSMKIEGHCTEWTLNDPKLGDPCDPIAANITYCCGFEEAGYTDNGFGAGSHEYVDGGAGDGISFESPGRTSQSRYACRINGGGNIKVPLTNGGQIRIGTGWVKRNANPGGPAAFLMMNWSSSVVGVLGFNSNGTLYANAGGGAVATSQVFAIGEWVGVEWYYNTTQNPAVLKWRVNGQDQTDATYSIAPFSLGPYEYFSGGDVTYDDFVFSLTPSDYPLGPYTVRGGYAEADGTHNVGSAGWKDEAGTSYTNGSTTVHNHLDPSLQGGVWMRPSSADGASYLELVPKQHSLSGDRPLAVYAAVVTEKEGIIGDNYFEFRIVVDGVQYTVYAGSGQWNVIKVNYQHYMNKPGGGQWDLASINAMRYRLGYSSDIGPNNKYFGVMTEQAFKDGSACDDVP